MNFLNSSISRKSVLAISIILLVTTSLFVINTYHPFGISDEAKNADTVSVVKEKPLVLYGMVVNDKNVVEDQVKKNQRFLELFKDAYVTPGVWQQLNTLSRKIFDFRKISALRKYTLIAEKDSLKSALALIYEPNPIDYVIFHLKDSLQVEICKREVKTVEKNVSGRIESSLSQTIEALNISNELTNKFVDVFGWQVDFQRLQKGDQFKLIYEENQVENKAIGIGKILAINFQQSGRNYYAFPFNQGDGNDYFDEEGKSLRKALLKYPIEFTRISSRYSMNRFHPVAKVYRAHLGTDFAAPTGTPIRSVGDGVIEQATFTSNNGNFVKVHHNATYSTAYLHMSKIAEGITAGVHVKQGQTIGYVGSTGLATGPHVCYRFWRNGVQIDALNVELPPSQPVKKEYLDQFEVVKKDLIRRLDVIPFPAATPEVIVVSN